MKSRFESSNASVHRKVRLGELYTFEEPEAWGDMFCKSRKPPSVGRNQLSKAILNAESSRPHRTTVVLSLPCTFVLSDP